MDQKPVTAVIFDKDGTIMDTEAPACAVWQRVFGEHGLTLTPEGYAAFLGLSYKDGIETIRQYRPDCGAEELLRECSERTNAFYFANPIPLKPGLTELLALLKQKGIKIALATASRRYNAEMTLQKCGLLSEFPVLIHGEMVENGKPAPDIFLLAAKRLGVSPGDCLVVEDSDAGVRAALAAGMRVALVPDMACNTPEVVSAATYLFGSLYGVADLFA